MNEVKCRFGTRIREGLVPCVGQAKSHATRIESSGGTMVASVSAHYFRQIAANILFVRVGVLEEMRILISSGALKIM